MTTYATSRRENGQPAEGMATHTDLRSALQAWATNARALQSRGGGKSILCEITPEWPEHDEGGYTETLVWKEHCEGGYAFSFTPVWGDEIERVWAKHGDNISAQLIADEFNP